MLRAQIQVGVGSLGVDVEIGVAPGEVLAILGPNGAGKTTLLRCLAGLVALDAGRIVLDDTVLDDPQRAVFVPAERRPVATVFQDYLLFGHLSALDNVAFGLRARGVARAAAGRLAAEWLARVGLAELGAARPRALSGGQAQRVALARALATSPRLLLLDEPLAALDARARPEVRRDLKRHLASVEGMRVLVTHDPLDVYALADRVAVVDAGRIVQTGTIGEVTAHPRSRFVAELVGTNLVRGTVRRGSLTTEGGATIVIADAPDGACFAVVRPQAIMLSRGVDPGSSARNTWAGTVGEVERVGDRVRVGIEGVFGAVPLTAEITVAAMEALALHRGDPVHAAVKATDIVAYPA